VCLADELQVGFLHRSKGDPADYYCVSVVLGMMGSIAAAIAYHGL
jgi:hypothetical protein